jgi:hypothetical protein
MSKKYEHFRVQIAVRSFCRALWRLCAAAFSPVLFAAASVNSVRIPETLDFAEKGPK